MIIRKVLLLIALALLFLAVFMLITGSPLLLTELSEGSGFPLGTLIAWLGMIAIPLVILTGFSGLYRPKTRQQKAWRRLLLGFLLLAICWGGIGHLLAGNWAYTFSGSSPSFRGSSEAGRYFWIFSYATVALPLLFLIVFGVFQFVRRRRA